jgi:hypothetical protein
VVEVMEKVERSAQLAVVVHAVFAAAQAESVEEAHAARLVAQVFAEAYDQRPPD